MKKFFVWLSVLVMGVIASTAFQLALPANAHASLSESPPGTEQFSGRDVYNPDVMPNPNGQGWIMWYGGWQTQQTADSGQGDTIYERTAPAYNGPWTTPTTVLVAAQVAPQITEVNHPAVSVATVGNSLVYTMFFTVLACQSGSSVCTNAQQLESHGQTWSAISLDGINWGSFQRLTVSDPNQVGVTSPWSVVQPSGAQQWLVYYHSGCQIGVASVDANRNVISDGIVYKGTGSQCMASPHVVEVGNTWYMFFNVLEPTYGDSVRFDIWQTSSNSPTDWSHSTPSLAFSVDGINSCALLAPDVVPVNDSRYFIYYGRVGTGASGRCGDLTQSSSMELNSGAFPTDPPGATSPPGPSQGCVKMAPGSVVGMYATPTDFGYWIVDNLGHVDACGDASTSYGQITVPLTSPIVGMSATPDGRGYWLVASDGGIFSFGDAGFFGSAGGLALNKPIVGMASTPDGSGYWLVASDGGIFSFGDARFHGSTGSINLNKPIVGMAVDPVTGGYWIDASDGGIFAFDAPFYGSMGGRPLAQPVVGMNVNLANDSYYLVAADGGVFAFGAPFLGSTGSIRLARPIVAMESGPAGFGYRFVASDGGVFSFGTSQFYGSAA
ncbi:MAG TPA: hypothetical protein VHU85_15495 [Acidimicrobiales bacterium]|nr:hypothetical protein [Acidimicrobiales bacterium]